MDEAVAEQQALLPTNRERPGVQGTGSGKPRTQRREPCLHGKYLEEIPQSEAMVRERQLLQARQKLLEQVRNPSHKRLRRVDVLRPGCNEAQPARAIAFMYQGRMLRVSNRE